MISRRFCQMMGGDIMVASEPGEGSVFYRALAGPRSEGRSDCADPGATSATKGGRQVEDD
jgi:hypothetical protein